MKKLIAIFLTAVMLMELVPVSTFAQDAEVLTLQNDYLAYDLNSATGAFMIRTLEGHPQKEKDNHMPLLFDGGFQTSYTTVRIDGEDYIFGKNYGFLGMDSALSQPVLDQGNQTLSVKWRIKEVEITQTAELKTDPQNPLSGNVGLRYAVKNLGSSEKQVGIRVLLDNALGTNDAPFVLSGAQNLPTFYETEFSGADLPDQIRFADNYLSANVMSYALINSWSDSNPVIPDRAVVGHWARMADTRWEYSINDGLRFTSPTNSLKTADTASLYYFDPVSYAPSAEKHLEMMYGVGDFSSDYSQDNINVSISFDNLPELNEQKDGYINDGEFKLTVQVDNTVDNAQLHQGATLYLSYDSDMIEVIHSPSEDSDHMVGIGAIEPGQILTYEWTLRAREQTYYMSSEFVTSLASSLTNAYNRSYILLPSVKGNLPEFTIDTVAPTEVYHKGGRLITLKGSYSAETLKAAAGQQWGVYLENTATNDAYHVKASDIRFIGEKEDTISICYNGDLPLGVYRVVINFTGGLSEIFGNGTGKIIPDQTILVSNDPALVTKTYGVMAVLRHDKQYLVATFETEQEFQDYVTRMNLRSERTPEWEIMAELRGAVKKYDDGTTSYYYADPTEDSISINNILYYGNTDQPLYINETDSGVFLKGDGDLSVIGGMTFFKWGFELPFENGKLYSQSQDKVDGSEDFCPITIKYTGALNVIQNIAGFLFELNYGTLMEDWSDGKGYYSISFGGKIGINFFSVDGADDITESLLPPAAPMQEEKDSRSLAGLGLSAEIEDILFGMQSDGSVGFRGINTTVGVGLPEDYFGSAISASPSFSLTINTIDDIYSLNGSIGLYVIECEGTLSVRVLDVTDSVSIPIPDELRFKLKGDQAVRIVPPFFSIYMLGGGISDIYDTLRTFQGKSPGLPPLTIYLDAGIELFEVLRAGGELYISPRGLGADLEFGMANIPAIKLRGSLDAQWADPFEVTLTGQIEVFDAIIGGATVHFENDLIKGTLFVRLVIPDEVPLIGGKTLASAEGYLSNKSVGAGATFLNSTISVVYYWGTDELEFHNGDNPFQFSASIEGKQAEQQEPVVTSNVRKLDVPAAPSSRLLSNDITIPVSSEMKGKSALFIELPYTGATPSAGEITINGRAAVQADENGQGGSFLADGSRIILSVQNADYVSENQITISCSNPATTLDMQNYGVYGVDGLARISAASTHVTDTELAYALVTSDVKAESAVNVFLTSDPNFKETLAAKTNSQAAGDAAEENPLTPLNHMPITGSGIDSGTLSIPDTLPSGTYYAVYTLSTEGELSTTYVDKSVPIVWENPNLPAAPAGVTLEPAGNHSFKVNIEGLDPSATEVFVELKDGEGNAVTGYEMLRFAAEEADQIYLGTQKAVNAFGIGENNELTQYTIAPLESGKEYQAVVTPARFAPGMDTIDGQQVYNENKIYYAPPASSGLTRMPTANPPELVSLDVADTVQAGERLWLTGEGYRATYKFDQPVALSVNVGGSIYAFTEEYKEEWNVELPLEDGNYYVMYTARNQAGDTASSDAATKAGVSAFTKDTLPPMLYVEQTSAAMAYGGTVTLSGVSEAGAVITAPGVTTTADAAGKFQLSLPFAQNSLQQTYYLTATDAAGNKSYLQVAAVNGDVSGIDALSITSDHPAVEKTITVKTGEAIDLKALGRFAGPLGEQSVDVTGQADWTLLYNGASATLDGPIFTPHEKGEYVVRAQLAGATYLEGDNADAARYSAMEDVITIVADDTITPTPKPGGGGSGGSSSISKLQRDLNALISQIGSEYVIKVIEAHPSRQTSVQAADGISVIVPVETVSQENRFVMHKKLADRHEDAFLPDDQLLSEPFTFTMLYEERLKKDIVLNFDPSGQNGRDVGLYRYNSYFDAWELIKESSNNTSGISCRIDDPDGQYVFLARDGEKDFTDVEMSHWAMSDIYRLASLGVIEGYSDGLFQPENGITRAEFLALLLRMLKVDVTMYESAELDTLDADEIPSWALAYFKAGFALDIMHGIGADGGQLAGADLPIQRMDAVLLLYNAARFEAEGALPSFTDQGELPDYAAAAVLNMAAEGIISGYPDGSFRGADSITRAETSAVLANWLDLVLSKNK